MTSHNIVMRQRTLNEFFPQTPSAAGTHGRTIVLPWQEKRDENNSPHGYIGWDIVTAALMESDTTDTSNLRILLQVLYTRKIISETRQVLCFGVLCHVLDHVMTAEERVQFFCFTLPWMKRAVLRGPELFPQEIPILSQSDTHRLLFTHEEASTLLVCGFFSLFQGRSQVHKFGSSSGLHKLPSFNFVRLLCNEKPDRFSSQCAKVQCLLQYFRYCARCTKEVWPCVEIYRVARTSFPDFERSTRAMEPVVISENSLIEESYTNLQVDFANRCIGGGVLSSGCLQEEIRFVTSPELLLSCLVCEELLDNEVVFVAGAASYSVTEGYAKTFRYISGCTPDIIPLSDRMFRVDSCEQGMHVDKVPVKLVGRNDEAPRFVRNTCIVAMDAVDFSDAVDNQFRKDFIIRETHKAFVAFKGIPDSTLSSVHSGPIATGNWGCGAFGGDRELKLLLQWCAASQAGRPLIYSAFGDVALCSGFHKVYKKLREEEWTVGEVFTMILFCSSMFPRPRNQLFECFLTMPWCRLPLGTHLVLI
ncbi:poly(ADP-ribose) glycohydrolase, putative [Trypanosoma brucei gambiense DAL972]|uniref:poly(ADP-ribose) glycohydrolase n=2 Tax=Trypanosoma brucei TaxID=5691 RepID=C9ZZ61_TRYB9|nr:poly(ADP-ribose) glycohydrolase, putative [Trypanosoma brucei gambiense DAL972]CBH14710.1 poly(ADP-ribose) glycohydrolase, putative [Trypanosoma brucei gambiense DAL972]|eukprot:XP_011776976.1 poly(ADP-ribose) glycohydrolase, putative [Trypanosoma brucei gambiense DAL972]